MTFAARATTFLSVVAAAGLLALACGKGPDSTFDPSARDGSADGSSGGFDPREGGTGADGSSGGACVTTSTEAKLTPVNLVVMFDRSGSMGDPAEDPSYDPALRWLPVGAAMKGFFADAASKGLSASLTFFPSITNSCALADYAAADVALRALPDPLFSQTLDATAPKGDTPTRAAVSGAILQAQAVRQARPTDKTVLVLVTDGEPFGCGVTNATEQAQEVSRVSADVAAVKATIPTYVIGVGPSVAALDAVATAGGTTAFHVQVGTPAQTTQQLIAAMAQIRSQSARCDFDIPIPPDGRKVDLDKVNVVVERPGQPPATLPFDKDCTGAGFRFDPPAAPTKVLLCPAACDDVRATAGGKVNVVFACVARPDVPR